MLMRRLIGREGFLDHPAWKRGAEISVVEIYHYNGNWMATDSQGFRHFLHQLEPVNKTDTIIPEVGDARAAV